jgi:hypothetical protein
MVAKLQNLIPAQDNIDVVRDKIATILAEETASQQAYAIADGKDPEDYKIRVLLESSNPIAKYQQQEVSDRSPIVNVWLDGYNVVQSSSNSQELVLLATYNIDIYGYGVSKDAAQGHEPGDKAAALRAQSGLRLVRNILLSGYYRYLDLRGIVSMRDIESVNAFQPEILGQAVQKVQGLRMALTVKLREASPEYQGANLEIVHVDVLRDSDDFVLAQAEYDYTTP